jgi:dienelactone hydrolase
VKAFCAAVVLLGTLLSGGITAQQPRTFPIGTLVEHVQSASNPTQQFALYLPKGFESTRPTPILFLLDPRGRAPVPARLFQAAADRFGYILISSYNTSSDSPVDPNFVAMQAMWADATRWFTLDPGRIYVAGFSGTARTATRLAQTRQVITGVIGAGAGFHEDTRPSTKVKFLYYGTVGTVDYNYDEVDLLGHTLAGLDFPHRIETFPGPHSWMPKPVAMRAVEWFELRAMQAGKRPRDLELIDELWSRDAAIAADRLGNGQWLDAGRRYAAMARDFDGLRDVAFARSGAERLLNMAEARTELTRRRTRSRQSIAWVTDKLRTIGDAFPAGAAKPAMTLDDLSAELTISRLKTQAAGDASDDALEARRRLNQIGVQLGFYLPQDALDRGKWFRAGYYLNLSMEIDDESPVAWYLMAKHDARLGRSGDAIAALTRAVDCGFRDLSQLESDPAFGRMRTEPALQALVHRLQQSGDTLNVLTVDRPPVSARK